MRKLKLLVSLCSRLKDRQNPLQIIVLQEFGSIEEI